MVSRRNFFSIATIMAIIFFLFQFTNIALEAWNNYDANRYAVDIHDLKDRGMAYLAGLHGDTGENSWGEPRGTVVFVGEAESPMEATVKNWATSTKRAMGTSRDLEEWVGAPELLVVDAAALRGDWQVLSGRLTEYTAAGVNVVFGSLPDVGQIAACQELRDLLGIEEVRGENAAVAGLHLYRGFLLGGEVIYQGKDQAEDLRRQDMDLSFPWYVLSAGTKTYMKGIPEDGSLRPEEHPAVIWRRSAEPAYVFAVNGSYLEDAAGLGILSAIAAESRSYSVYPVVNAQGMVAASFPSLAMENSQELLRRYSRSMRGLFQDILWPDLAGVYQKSHMGLTCMMAPELDYSDGAKPDQALFISYMKSINALSAEAGLTGQRVSDTDMADKLASDFAFLEAAKLEYQFTAFYGGELPEKEVMDALGWEGLSSLRTVVSAYTGGSEVIGWQSERVTRQTAIADGLDHTFMGDLRVRALETALGYNSVLVDAGRVVWPSPEDSSWEVLSERLKSDIAPYRELFGAFDAATASQCDQRIRDMLALDFTESIEGQQLTLRTDGTDGPVWFILRTANATVEKVEGGSFRRIEAGAFLIQADQEEIVVTLRGQV